jgi:xanthosine utilization system XapX-like protein
MNFHSIFFAAGVLTVIGTLVSLRREHIRTEYSVSWLAVGLTLAFLAMTPRALVGLLGILAGEQVIPLAKQLITGSTIPVAWRRADCGEHIFGLLPGTPAIHDSADLEEERS